MRYHCEPDCHCVAHYSDIDAFSAVQLGGVGVLHYNCTVEEQRAMVAAVKSHRPGCMPTPFVVSRDLPAREYLAAAVRRSLAG